MPKPRTGSVYRKNNKWYIAYTIGGKQHHKATNCRTKTEAREYLNKFLPKTIDYLDRGNILFSDFVSEWYENRKVRLRPSSLAPENSCLKKHILPYFGDKKLKDIYSSDIQSFVRELSKKLKPKTINNILGLLNLIFEDALDDKRIEFNPVILKKHRVKVPKKERDFFTPEEAWKLIESASGDFKVFLITAWNTGMRPSEITGLKWEDINFQEGIIYVRRAIYQKKGKIYESEPKTKAGYRKIYMTPTLKTVLQEFKKSKKIEHINGYIFQSDGKPWLVDGYVKSAFKRTLRLSGLRNTLTFYSLRHGFISVARLHIPLYVVKLLVGHSLPDYDVTTTYTHLTNEQLHNYAVKLDKILNEDSPATKNFHFLFQRN